MKLILLAFLIMDTWFCQNNPSNHSSTHNCILRDSGLFNRQFRYKSKKISITCSSNGVLIIKDLSTHTIIKQDTLGAVSQKDIRIEDYNGDGVPDIRYGYNSNYFYENVLLFDRSSQTWKEVKDINSTDFAYSERIPHAQVYYSYTPDGCGKNNWVSYLFVIGNFTVKPIGLLEYKQCIDDQKGIYLYKIKNDMKVFIRKFPLESMNQGNIYKRYWLKHYQQFLP